MTQIPDSIRVTGCSQGRVPRGTSRTRENLCSDRKPQENIFVCSLVAARYSYKYAMYLNVKSSFRLLERKCLFNYAPVHKQKCTGRN